jgi:hypothetical protein
MNSKFALFFFFQEKVIGKINTPEHHSKNGIFMEFLGGAMVGVVASHSHHRLGNERSLRSELKGCECVTARLK